MTWTQSIGSGRDKSVSTSPKRPTGRCFLSAQLPDLRKCHRVGVRVLWNPYMILMGRHHDLTRAFSARRVSHCGFARFERLPALLWRVAAAAPCGSAGARTRPPRNSRAVRSPLPVTSSPSVQPGPPVHGTEVLPPSALPGSKHHLLAESVLANRRTALTALQTSRVGSHRHHHLATFPQGSFLSIEDWLILISAQHSVPVADSRVRSLSLARSVLRSNLECERAPAGPNRTLGPM